MQNPETIPIRNPGTLKMFHEKLRHFQHLSMTGPQQAVSQIQKMCREWLQPETHSKEQMIEQLVLEQFLSTLPEDVQTWVRSKQPKNSREASTLVTTLIKACEEKGKTKRKQLVVSDYRMSAICLSAIHSLHLPPPPL
uniref:SCAN box domain-containing protein n=1 Tax=Castor canadensis TaxID=51338 RepID=A0A8C0W4F4_CASCN